VTENKNEELVEGTSLLQDGLRRFRRNAMALTCSILALLFFLITITPHVFGLVDRALSPANAAQAPSDLLLAVQKVSLAHTRQDLAAKNTPPGAKHWFGTDNLGRDLFARVVFGGGISFLVAIVGTTVSLLIGVSYGAIAGYAGGRIDNLMMRFVDILYGLPYMFVVIVFMTLFAETGGMLAIFLGLGLVQWLTMARIVRGQVITLRKQEFVTAARVIGASPERIIFFHLIPNLLGPVIVYSTLTVPGIMLQESFLSFLGLGIREPDCSWGSLASEGIQAVSPVASYWWQLAFPCGALAMTLFSLNFIGDGLRDALDPKGQR
jgi:oligopeptide transport system permease protein